MKKEKGITLIALIFIVIAIGMILYIGIKYTLEYYTNQKKEDIKAHMLAIQTVTTNIENMHSVSEEENPLIGTKVEFENAEFNYNISNELKQVLETQENSNLYILSEEELNNCGIKDIHINEDEFYIVDYNSEEIFYSKGINGKYRLSEI